LENLQSALLAEGIRSMASIPLAGQRRLIGRLKVYFDQPHAFTDAEMSLLRTISYHAAYAIERRIAETDRSRLLEREQQARLDAERANRLKDEFLALVSHEIRTPLGAITGWCHLLKSGNLDAQGAERALETITRNAHLQARLIDDILDVSGIITGKLQLHKTPILLSHVVRGAADSIRPAAEARKISVDVTLPPKAAAILGDGGRLQQVVSNVLSNAVKFSPDGSLIEVRVEQDASSSTITVSDRGQGITAEFLPHVFERFRQADGSSTRKHSGLGLGLTIARHLVELHDGSMSVHSDGPGLGTMVTIVLPVMPAGHRLPLQPLRAQS
jgi:signal transduction histidine kinase